MVVTQIGAIPMINTTFRAPAASSAPAFVKTAPIAAARATPAPVSAVPVAQGPNPYAQTIHVSINPISLEPQSNAATLEHQQAPALTPSPALTRLAPISARTPGQTITQPAPVPGYVGQKSPFGGGPATVVAAPPSAVVPGLTPDPGTAAPTVDPGAAAVQASSDPGAPAPAAAPVAAGGTTPASSAGVPGWAIALGAAGAAVAGYFAVRAFRKGRR